MNWSKIFFRSVFLLFVSLCACDHEESFPESEWLYFGIVTDDTLNFSRIYAQDGTEIYKWITYSYPESEYGLYEHNSLKLPLSPFTDSVTYIFEQTERTDTLKVTYRQGPEFFSRRRGILYLFQDHQITYTTFDSVVICERCY